MNLDGDTKRWSHSFDVSKSWAEMLQDLSYIN